MYKIPFIRPNFPTAQEVSDDFSKIVESNWYTNFGPYEQLFRKQVADYLGNDVNVVTTANATVAIEVAVSALFPKNENKREVLVQSFTFAAGPEVLVRLGYTPVFIDVDPVTWQPNLKQAEQYLEAHENGVVGILLCNTFGVGNPDIDAWEAFSKKSNLPMIIDSAAGFGSEYSLGELIGARGDCEIFSLHATKPFCVGEGGLIVTRNSELAEQCRQMENFGFNSSHEVAFIGTNAKLQEINCAIGLRQLEKLGRRLALRREKFLQLRQALGSSYSYQRNYEYSSVPFAALLFETESLRDTVLERLRSRGVEAKRYYDPLHQQAVLMKYCKIASTLLVTENIASRIIALPLYESMSREELALIVSLVSDDSL